MRCISNESVETERSANAQTGRQKTPYAESSHESSPLSGSDRKIRGDTSRIPPTNHNQA